MTHEADKPYLVSDFSNPHHLAGKHGTEIDFAFADADASASSHPYGAVVKRVFGFRWWLVDSSRRCIYIARINTVECLVGPFIVVNPDKAIKAFLLLQEVGMRQVWWFRSSASGACARDDRSARGVLA